MTTGITEIELSPGRESMPKSDLSGFDDRQQAVIHDGRFFEPYKKELYELFRTLGKEKEWSENPRNLLQYMRTRWIGGEHGNSAGKDQFTPEEIAAASPLLEQLGLLNELLPPKGMHSVDVLIVGGTTVANYRRLKFVLDLLRDHHLTTDKITLLAGQRPREARDGTNEELLATGGRFAGNDIRQNTWVRQMQKAREAFWFPDETALWRVVVMKALPRGEKMKPARIDLQVTNITGLTDQKKENAVPKRVGNIPPRDVADYYFDLPIENGEQRPQRIVIVNGAAIPREQGKPRHTTASVTKEWLKRLAPPQLPPQPLNLPRLLPIPEDKTIRVLYVTGNPHTLRTAQDTYKMIADANRDDIRLDFAGTCPVKGTPIQTPLGEVARLIGNDVKRNYPTDF
jgi:hypothetical protein